MQLQRTTPPPDGATDNAKATKTATPPSGGDTSDDLLKDIDAAIQESVVLQTTKEVRSCCGCC